MIKKLLAEPIDSLESALKNIELPKHSEPLQLLYKETYKGNGCDPCYSCFCDCF